MKQLPCFKATEQGTILNLSEGESGGFTTHALSPPLLVKQPSAAHFNLCGATRPGSWIPPVLMFQCFYFGLKEKKCPDVASALFGQLVFYLFSLSKFSVCSFWDSDVVRLRVSTLVGVEGTLPLESDISRVRRSLSGFSHLVTRNLPTARTVTSPW